MVRTTRSLLLLGLGLMAACGGGRGSGLAPGEVAVAVERVFPALSFQRPVALLQSPDDPTRWFVVEQGGRVLVFPNEPTVTVSRVYADVSGLLGSSEGEAGLLGMAFHPDFDRNGRVFLSYTAPGVGDFVLTSRVSRFTSSDGGSTVDPASEDVVLSVGQPFVNHNGGNIAFGPDGFLYVGLGDGGSGGDPQGNAQNPDSLLGKMLRIDVGSTPYAVPPDNPFAGGGGRPEIYALGLRNPWRWSFDRATGALWAGDVGENDWEEVDRIERGGNYGWNRREGAHCFRASVCDATGLTDPVVEYSHAEGQAVTGGYVYRGTAIRSLRGEYVYGDFGSGRIWAVAAEDPIPTLLAASGLAISSFGKALDGELYLLDYGGGSIHRLVPAPANPP